MTTMNDVSALAGVSVATVSNYLNGTKSVKPETKKRIKDAIEALNFHPSTFARNLKMNNSSEIAIVIPDAHNSYYSYILQGIEKVFQSSAYYLNIAFSHEIPELELNALQKLIRKNVKGVILVTCQPENHQYFKDNFITPNIPIVFLDRNLLNLDTNFIYFDNKKTIHFLIHKLFENDFSKIALITGPKEYFSENECLVGYQDAFRDEEKEWDPRWISYTNLSKEDSFRSAISIFQNNSLEAIITSSESIAQGVLEAALIRGISVPENLSILSLGQEYWNYFSASFGTIVTMRPALNMGEEAAKLLQRNMNSPILFEKQKLVLEDKILFKSLDFSIKSHRVHSSKITKETLNILMLESPATSSFKGLLPHFTKDTSINVNIHTYPQQYILNRIVTDAQQHSDEMDVYMFDIPWLPYLASNHNLFNMSKLLNNPSFNKERYIPDCFKYFSQFHGEYYGVPFLYGPQLLFYRKDLFAERDLQSKFERKYQAQLRPPRTWLEFNAIAEFFTHSANPESPVEFGTSIAANFSEVIVPEFLPRLWAYKGKIFTHENKVSIDSPESIKALHNFCSTFKFIRPDTLEIGIEQTVADFYEGKTAMLISYVNYTTDINNRFKSKIAGKIGYDLIPGRAPILPGWSLGINPHSKDSALAFKFINWACGSDICNHYTILDGQSTLLEVYQNDELLKLYPWLKLALENFKYCRPRYGPYTPSGKIIPQNDIEFIVAKAIYAAVKEQAGIGEALAKSQLELESLFEKYGYLQD
jgi:DNA-binding LacI/PurR family transcriptional regulator/ABC-type glycerol-3-phosphate transport system substrate-binding protein